MGRIGSIPLAVGVIILLAVAPIPAHASVAVVPDDFATIQQALDSADTVWVRSGTYPERPRVEGQFAGGKLLRRHPASSDHPRLSGVFLVPNSHYPRIRLEGFEVTGPVQLAPGGYAGDIEIDACVLDSGVVQTSYGDGINLKLTRSRVHGDVRLRAVEVTVELDSDTLRAGGLIVDDQYLVAVVTDCVMDGPGLSALDLGRDSGRATITGNRIDGYRTGILGISDVNFDVAGNAITNCDVGIHLFGDVVSVRANEIRDCGIGILVQGDPGDEGRVTDNRVLGSGQVGIRVQNEGPFTLVERNVVGRSAGPGIVVETVSQGDDFPPAIIRNNTSYRNLGPGFVLAHESWDSVAHLPPRLINNIAFGNGGFGLEWRSTGAYPETPLAALDHTCNDWYANVQGAVNATPQSPLDLELDPQFCDAGSDSVSLQASSPLLDAEGCGLIGARGQGCATTAMLVTLFQVDRYHDIVRVLWRLGVGASVDRVWVERAERADGPWGEITTERSSSDDGTVDVDRTAVADRSYWYRLATVTDGVTEVVTAPVEAAPFPPAGFELRTIWSGAGDGPPQVIFELPHPASVVVEVLDLQGRSVAVLARGTWPLGRHEIEWPADGSASPGVFFIRYLFPGGEATRKLVLLR